MNGVRSEFFYIQFAALDLLQSAFAKRKGLKSALLAYKCLCAIASETDAEPSPERDGAPFEAPLFRIAWMCSQPTDLTRARLKDFVDLGLIDRPDPSVPVDKHVVAKFRLRVIQGGA